jgi:uncharacterized protein YydD (DUF2326 family)
MIAAGGKRQDLTPSLPREAKRNSLDRRRSELMSMLKSHGALDQFIALQAEHGRLQGEAETLRRRFAGGPGSGLAFCLFGPSD